MRLYEDSMEDRGAVLATLCGLRGILMALNPKPLDPQGRGSSGPSNTSKCFQSESYHKTFYSGSTYRLKACQNPTAKHCIPNSSAYRLAKSSCGGFSTIDAAWNPADIRTCKNERKGLDYTTVVTEVYIQIYVIYPESHT